MKRASVRQLLFNEPLPLPLSSRVIMGLRPTRGDEKSLRPATTLYRTVAPSFVIPSAAEGSAVPRTSPGNVFRRCVPGFPTSPLSPATTHVVLSKENHTQLTEAATLDRKSRGAEGSAVRPSVA